MAIATRVFLVLLVAWATSACSTATERVAKSPRDVRPSSLPVQNITSFSDALVCMDKLIGRNVDHEILLITEDIPNKSGKPGLAQSGKEMLIGAISAISAQSKRIKYVSYDEKDMPTLMKLFVHKNRGKPRTSDSFEFPAYFVRGAITQVEKEISKGGKDVSVGVPSIARLGYADVKSMSLVALDLNMGDMRNLQILPGVSSRNVLAVFAKGDGFEAMAGIIAKAEINFSMEFSQSEAMSAAIRNLVDLGTLELIGKFLNLSYRDCLHPGQRATILANNDPFLPVRRTFAVPELPVPAAPPRSQPAPQPAKSRAVMVKPAPAAPRIPNAAKSTPAIQPTASENRPTVFREQEPRTSSSTTETESIDGIKVYRSNEDTPKPAASETQPSGDKKIRW